MNCALTDNLAAVVDLVNGRDKINFVVDGLGPKFQPFISSIRSQPKIQFAEFIHVVIRENTIRQPSMIHSLSGMTSQSTPLITNSAFIALMKSSLHYSEPCDNRN